MISGQDIRKKFLEYFKNNKHSIVKSGPLIPQNDPTLFFTNAGMVPFKNVFTGEEKRDYSRATSVQKCMRVSGKHNDLENVGRTPRHHTFFEMLGNFSFGDYFKKEAIEMAWEFLTEVVKLPKEKLWITVYKDDNEAYDLWKNHMGIPEDRIVRLGEKDNFWSMGETGPCGPCSEIHYEQDLPGSEHLAGKFQDHDRFMEIWNLVFMQFDRQKDGTLKALPKPSIDTGMGLERLVAVLQNQLSNYDSDLFTPLLTEIAKIVRQKYGASEDQDVSMRVIADHIRSTVFLIGDGVLPSNEGRGYVLRRIMRRAIRHGKQLGMNSPFFYRLVQTVVNEMGEAYPEIKTNQSTIEKVVQSEEERFFETLEKGLKLLDEEVANLKASKKTELSGSVAFKLYDTFGFPLDLTQIILEEQKLTVDQAGFDECMKEQKERARAGWKGSGEAAVQSVYLEIAEKHQVEFLGYETLEATSNILALIQNGKQVEMVSEGDFEFITSITPFYGEGGGQVGDKGHVFADNIKAEVKDTQKPVPGLFVHKAKILEGTISLNDTITLHVNRNVRKPTMRNHTATHILHAVLRDILGDHVRQAGSLVNDQMLRFDFSHFEGIDAKTLQKIETEVNRIVLESLPVSHEEMSMDDATKKGALAFFGDKYGDHVRVVSVGDVSVELCGGTHLHNSAEVGLFKIISESSIAAGTRRIEAVTGEKALEISQQESQTIKNIADSLKAKPADVTSKVEKLQSKVKASEKEIEKLKKQLLQGGASDLLSNKQSINNIDVAVYDSDDASSARDVAIAMRDQIKSGIVVVNVSGSKNILVVGVTKDLQKDHPAKSILDPLAEKMGGRGGGKADLAQAGGAQSLASSEIFTTLQGVL